MDHQKRETTQYWRRILQPTLHNTNPLPFVTNGIMCLVVGTVKFTTDGGDVDTFRVPATAPLPYIIPVQASIIWATGTDIAASNLRIGR